MSDSKPTVIDFLTPQEHAHWITVDDPVMGGRSHSDIQWISPTSEDTRAGGPILRFRGRVSLDNGGGFCSTRLQESPRPATGVESIVLRVRGDGKRYKITLRTTGTPPSSSWRLPIDSLSQTWRVHRLSLADFELWRRGQLLDAEGRPNPEHLCSAGILIADKQEGSFQLDIAEFRGL